MKYPSVPDVKGCNCATYCYTYSDYMPRHIEEMNAAGWRIISLGSADKYEIQSIVWERGKPDGTTPTD